MIKTLLTASISFLLISSSASVCAQGNANTGKATAATCAGCHGEDGNSTMPSFPKLAGQHKDYLVKQLQLFKSGLRQSPMMSALAASLDDQSTEDVSAFYAGNKITTNQGLALPINDDDDDAPAKTDEKKKEELVNLIAKGGDLYRNGNLTTKVSACIACHGPYGEGNRPANFPALHAQHPDYLIKTLVDFKNGIRSKSPENMMHMIAAKMSEQEIKAVAYYIAAMK